MRSWLPAEWQVSSPTDCWCPSPARPCRPSPFSRCPGSASSLGTPSSLYPDSVWPLPLAWPDLDSSSVCLSLSPHHLSRVWRCAAVPVAVASACCLKSEAHVITIFLLRSKQCFGSVFIWSGSEKSLNTDPDPDPIRTQGFDDQKMKKVTGKKKSFFEKKKLQFTFLKASIKEVQATEEAFSPQKRTSSTS